MYEFDPFQTVWFFYSKALHSGSCTLTFLRFTLRIELKTEQILVRFDHLFFIHANIQKRVKFSFYTSKPHPKRRPFDTLRS